MTLSADADSRSAASGTSVTTTPTQGSPSPDPADATTSMEHKQRIYLKHQAQRVVQQHSIAADGSVTPHYFEPGEPSLSISGSLPPTGAVDAEQLRSHSQLLLEQQRLLQNMQQMVHDREGGDQSARSSWDGLKGYMTNIAGKLGCSTSAQQEILISESRTSSYGMHSCYTWHPDNLAHIGALKTSHWGY